MNRTLDRIENKAIQTRMADPVTGAMIRKGNQKMVAGNFRHDTSMNHDPQLDTHALIANLVQGEDQGWRTVVTDGVYRGVMAIGAIYRAELANGLEGLVYGMELTNSDGRFEIGGVSREVIEAFSTRRAVIVEAMQERGLGEPGDNARIAERPRRPGFPAIGGTRSAVFGPPPRPGQPARGAPGRCRGDDVAEQAQKVHLLAAVPSHAGSRPVGPVQAEMEDIAGSRVQNTAAPWP